VRDVSFVFAGRGFADVETQIRDAATKDARITFEAGYITPTRKHDLYTTADIVALPYTEFASVSMVLRDAYAYHVPVVATDVGALGATVHNDGTGWVAQPHDVAGLANALRTALEDTAGWRAAATQARRIAAERTPTMTGRRLRALYDTLGG
jgi:glycosyltransferase involved in cell wall biosynthesis